jgi:hypothetical protein
MLPNRGVTQTVIDAVEAWYFARQNFFKSSGRYPEHEGLQKSLEKCEDDLQDAVEDAIKNRICAHCCENLETTSLGLCDECYGEFEEKMSE